MVKARAKGTSAERELVRILKDAGVECRRVWMSGQLKELGDIKISYSPYKGTGAGRYELQGEVKRYGRLFQEYKWLEKDKSDLVFKRSDNENWLCVLPLKLFIELIKE